LEFDDFLSNTANFVEPDSLVTIDNHGRLTAGLFRSAATPKSVLIFYHGGGASMVGYGGLAHTLRLTAPIAVLTPDVRGHGKSSGPRGFAPTPDLVWSDVEAAVAWAMIAFPGTPIFVGGHSSGGGLVINWAAHRLAGAAPVAGLVLLAPFVGMKLQRPGGTFATARAWVFLAYLLSGKRLMVRTEAVRFSYPKERAEAGDLVRAYSAGMSMAVTPRDALSALRRIDIPMAIIAATDDELLDTERLRDVSPRASFVVVPGTHLSCFLAAAGPIAQFLTSHVAG